MAAQKQSIYSKKPDELSLTQLYIAGVPELVGRENAFDPDPTIAAGIAAQHIIERRRFYDFLLQRKVIAGLGRVAEKYNVAEPIVCNNQHDLFATIARNMMPGKQVYANNVTADFRQRGITGRAAKTRTEHMLGAYDELRRFHNYYLWLDGKLTTPPPKRFVAEAERTKKILERESIEMWVASREGKISEGELIGVQWRVKWGVDCRDKTIDYIIRSIADPKEATQIARMIPPKRNNNYEEFYSTEFVDAIAEAVQNSRIFDVMGLKLVSLNYNDMLEHRERFLANLYADDQNCKVAVRLLGKKAEQNKFKCEGNYNAYHTVMETDFPETIEIQSINLEFFEEYFGKTDQRHDVMDQRSSWKKKVLAESGERFERSRHHQLIEDYLRWLLHSRFDPLHRGV